MNAARRPRFFGAHGDPASALWTLRGCSPPLHPQYIWILRLGGVGTAEVPTPGKSAMRPVCGHGAGAAPDRPGPRHHPHAHGASCPHQRAARTAVVAPRRRRRAREPSLSSSDGAGDDAEQACRSRRDAGLRHHQRANGARTPTSPPSRNRANFSRDPEFPGMRRMVVVTASPSRPRWSRIVGLQKSGSRAYRASKIFALDLY